MMDPVGHQSEFWVSFSFWKIWMIIFLKNYGLKIPWNVSNTLQKSQVIIGITEAFPGFVSIRSVKTPRGILP